MEYWLVWGRSWAAPARGRSRSHSVSGGKKGADLRARAAGACCPYTVNILRRAPAWCIFFRQKVIVRLLYDQQDLQMMVAEVSYRSILIWFLANFQNEFGQFTAQSALPSAATQKSGRSLARPRMRAIL